MWRHICHCFCTTSASVIIPMNLSFYLSQFNNPHFHTWSPSTVTISPTHPPLAFMCRTAPNLCLGFPVPYPSSPCPHHHHHLYTCATDVVSMVLFIITLQSFQFSSVAATFKAITLRCHCWHFYHYEQCCCLCLPVMLYSYSLYLHFCCHQNVPWTKTNYYVVPVLLISSPFISYPHWQRFRYVSDTSPLPPLPPQQSLYCRKWCLYLPHTTSYFSILIKYQCFHCLMLQFHCHYQHSYATILLLESLSQHQHYHLHHLAYLSIFITIFATTSIILIPLLVSSFFLPTIASPPLPYWSYSLHWHLYCCCTALLFP